MEIKKSIEKRLALLVPCVLVLFGIFVYELQADIRSWQNSAALWGVAKVAIEQRSDVAHQETPESVRGIYMTAATAGTAKFDALLAWVNDTELNTIVLDIKDWKGRPAFAMNRERLKPYNVSDPVILDIDTLIQRAHERGIYLVARIAVFQDPYLVMRHPEWELQSVRGGIWKDWKGVSWLDPTNHNVWEYNLELAREAYERGFDEINFDYIRFPSDGPTEQIVYTSYDETMPKYLAMKKFFAFLDHELRRDGVLISADLFGLTMGRIDGLGIGQRFEDAALFFDFVSPMVYPSHYPPRFMNFSNPASHPYEIIYAAMQWGSTKRNELASGTAINASGKPPAQLRPWLQDFDIGATYTAAMIQKEIQAVYDAGVSSWLLWNAANNYTENAVEKGN